MPYPTINFKDDDGGDFGNKFITKEYLMSVYPQIAGQLITPELWVWGYGTFGELGDNTAVTRSTPVTTFAGGVNWKQISSTKAIKTDGTLWAWGYNLNGQIGDNTVVTRSTPVTTFAGGTDWKQCSEIASIKTDGTLWTWGLNSSGQLGIIGTTNRSTPVTTFAGGTNWRYVASFNNNCAAIKTDGTLWL
jgi:alpha-tubulin suppressor-like RCC1 family protein